MPAWIIGGGLLSAGLQAGAASDAANANVEAAKIAADAQRFRPVGVTTRFGSSNFKYDDKGNVIGAGYDVAPDIANMRDRLLTQAGRGGFKTAEEAQQAQQNLFNLGNQYLAQSPEAAAQQWMQAQQNLLQPGRERAASGLTQNLFNTGRGGVAVSQGGTMGAANPELQALLNAQALQDSELATRAQEQGRAQTQFGAGLFNTGLDIASAGYNPLKTQFGVAQTMDQSGRDALELGINIGGRQTSANSNAANTIYQAQTNANNANAYSPVGDFLQGAVRNQQLVQGDRNWMTGPTQSPIGYGQSGTAATTSMVWDGTGYTPVI
jgi:hypothetical protein